MSGVPVLFRVSGQHRKLTSARTHTHSMMLLRARTDLPHTLNNRKIKTAE